MELFFKIFVFIIFIKAIINVNSFFRVKYYQKKYENYIKENNWKFLEYKPKIVELFERAGITNSLVPVVEPVGYGQITTANVPLFGNINVTRVDIVNLTRKSFYESIGIYRSRIVESFSPLYWISFFVYLPRKSLKYIGVKKNNALVNIIQIAYWIIMALIAFLNIKEIKFITDIKNWINSI